MIFSASASGFARAFGVVSRLTCGASVVAGFASCSFLSPRLLFMASVPHCKRFKCLGRHYVADTMRGGQVVPDLLNHEGAHRGEH